MSFPVSKSSTQTKRFPPFFSLYMDYADRMLERRKHKRFGLVGDPIAVAFVTKSSPDFCMAARVADIGSGGLALSHFGGRLPPHSLLNLDIILPGGIAGITKIMGDSIWDLETQGEPRLRRCGIRFRNLTDDQKAFVEYLIQSCTTPGAES